MEKQLKKAIKRWRELNKKHPRSAKWFMDELRAAQKYVFSTKSERKFYKAAADLLEAAEECSDE